MNVDSRALVQSAALHYSGLVISWTAFKAKLNHLKARQVLVWGKRDLTEMTRDELPWFHRSWSPPSVIHCRYCMSFFSIQQTVNVGQAVCPTMSAQFKIQHWTATFWVGYSWLMECMTPWFSGWWLLALGVIIYISGITVYGIQAPNKHVIKLHDAAKKTTSFHLLT